MGKMLASMTDYKVKDTEDAATEAAKRWQQENIWLASCC